MAIKRQIIVADFETTTTPNDVRVWAVCAVDVETLETVYIGNNLDGFMEWLSERNTVCYYHNAKFDLEFVFPWLFNHGFTHSRKGKEGTFDTLISDDGIVYSATVYFKKLNKKWKKVVFYDSLKKLPFKVSVISKAFELQDEKLSIDYDEFRPVGHELTELEKAYIVNDCRIVAAALKIQREQGLKRMTNASDAMNGYKDIISKKRFEQWFPPLPIELDAELRRAYKGGFVYLNPKYRGSYGLCGKQYDVNSLYPWVMYTKLLPYGYPVYFEGEPEENETYPLYIVKLSCSFKVKEGHIPTLQLKNNRAFIETEYLTTSNGEIHEFTLTSVDLKLFLEHYKPENLTYINGYRFKGATGMFKEYIDHWMYIKETSTGAHRQLAKLMLNSLYGKFATNPRAYQKRPRMDPDGIVRYDVLNEKFCRENNLPPPEMRDPVYTAMGAFITAYAREKTIRSAQANYERFIYADTDSLKLCGYEEPNELDIHPTHLGAWKDEGDFTNSKWIRAKTYMVTVNGETKVTCAGMPDNVKEAVTYENFHSGSTFEGKLMPRRYPGGIVLEKTTFTIK